MFYLELILDVFKCEKCIKQPQILSQYRLNHPLQSKVCSLVSHSKTTTSLIHNTYRQNTPVLTSSDWSTQHLSSAPASAVRPRVHIYLVQFLYLGPPHSAACAINFQVGFKVTVKVPLRWTELRTRARVNRSEKMSKMHDFRHKWHDARRRWRETTKNIATSIRTGTTSAPAELCNMQFTRFNVYLRRPRTLPNSVKIVATH